MSDQAAFKQQFDRAQDQLEMVVRSSCQYDDREVTDTFRAIRQLINGMRTKRQKAERA